MTLTEAARRVGVTPDTLRRWVRRGLVPQFDGEWTPSALGSARVVARMRERGHTLAEIQRATDEGRLAFGFLEELFPSDQPRAPIREATRARGAVMDLEPQVRDDGLLAAGRAVVVLYSGGRDSTCLLDVAVRIAGPAAVTALHVNYGLRESADEDEHHCARTCRTLGVALVVRHGQAPVRGNRQAWARELRYAAARELALARDGDVAAGHTATDQVETILYRLASSPSRRALLGMRLRDGRLIRPLLSFTRAGTAAHCRARGLRWRDDETNASSAYARGRVRHQLVPALEAIHPAAQSNVLALAETLRDEAAVLDELVQGVLAGRSEIELSDLRRLAPALRRLVVQRLADAAAGGPAAGVGRRADEVAAMSDHGTTALDLPSGVRATARSGVVSFARTPALIESSP